MLILTCLVILIYCIYNIVSVCKFGIPVTLSYTYYYYNEIKKNLGYMFSAVMIFTALGLIAPWMAITTQISSWSSYLMLLPFLASGSIMFVGLAPNFKDKQEDKIHTISAICAAVFSILWCCIVCWKVGLIVVSSCLLLSGGIGHLTRTVKNCKIYWLETAAFISTFITILIEYIIL